MLSKQACEKKRNLFESYETNQYFLLNEPLEIQRSAWEASALKSAIPEHIRIKKIVNTTFKAEFLTKESENNKKVILYLHGGGNNQGSAITHRKLVSHIVNESQVNALVLDYPLSPEYPFPSSLHNARDTYQWLIAAGFSPRDIIFGGDSSGGGLVLSLMLLLKKMNIQQPSKGFLLSPMVDYTLSGESINSCSGKDPVISLDDLKQTVSYYCSRNERCHPLVSPLYGDLKGLPPLLIQVGTDELLFDDAVRLSKHARADAVNVEIEVWKGLWHVFQSSAGKVPEAGMAIKNIARFINNRM